MSYRVIVSPKALEALGAFIDYIAVDRQSPLTAARWLEKAWDAVQSLKEMPHRCPSAPESEFSRHTIRALVVDNCLFLYRVVESDRVVRVLGFRHGSQLPNKLDE